MDFGYGRNMVQREIESNRPVCYVPNLGTPTIIWTDGCVSVFDLFKQLWFWTHDNHEYHQGDPGHQYVCSQLLLTQLGLVLDDLSR